MENEQKVYISWVLFWTFWGVFVITCLATLAMLFLGFGEVQDSERDILVYIVVIESAGGLLALIYSVFNLKKDSQRIGDNSIKLKDEVKTLNNAQTIRFLGQLETFQAAKSLVENAYFNSKDGGHIINMRSTKDTKQQNLLYDAIIKTLNDHPKLEYTRIITLHSDPHLWMARRFLEKVGNRTGLRLIFTFAASTMPSAFISDHEVVLGLLGSNQEVKHGLHISSPPELIERFRDMYEELYGKDDKLTIVIKGHSELVSQDIIDTKISELVTKAEALELKVTRWDSIPEHLKNTWLSDDR
jgi:hypothetical protein